MTIQTHLVADTRIAEVMSDIMLVHSEADGLDLLVNIYYQDFDKMILHQHHLTPNFFDLKNGMAGEILQKFSNYRVRLAVVGDFDKLTNKRIAEFIAESNRTGQISFVRSVDEAIKKLVV